MHVNLSNIYECMIVCCGILLLLLSSCSMGSPVTHIAWVLKNNVISPDLAACTALPTTILLPGQWSNAEMLIIKVKIAG